MAIKLGFGTKATAAPAAAPAPLQDTSSLATIGQDYLAPLKAHNVELASAAEVSSKPANVAPPIFDLDQHIKPAAAPEAQPSAPENAGTTPEIEVLRQFREKFPKAYDNIPDDELLPRILAKYPDAIKQAQKELNPTLAEKTSAALGGVAEKGMENMSTLVPYAAPGAGKFTSNPEDGFFTSAGKMIGNLPGGVWNIGAGVANLGVTAAQEITGFKPSGSTGGAIIGGLSGLGKTVLDKGQEVADVGAEKGFLAGADKALDIATKTLVENPVELASAKPAVAAKIGQTAAGLAGKAAKPIISRITPKQASVLADEAVADFRQGIRPQQRGNKPIDSAAIQRETDSIKSGGNALVRHLEEMGVEKPKTLQEAVDVLSDAKKNAARKYSVDGVDAQTTAAQRVSEALSSRIEDARKRGVGKEYEKAIKELDEVGGSQTLGQAEDFLANLNKRISTAYRTGDFTGVEALEATRAMFRQELLNEVNKLSAKGPEYAQLRKDWGAMHQLQTQIDRMARLKAGKSAVGLMDQLANLGTASAIADVFVTGGATAALKVAGLQGAKWYAKFLNSPERGLGNFIDKMQKARAKGYGEKIITDSVAEAAKQGAAKAAAQDFTRMAAPSKPMPGPVFKPTGKRSPTEQFTKGTDVNQPKTAAPDVVDEFLGRGVYVKSPSIAQKASATSEDIVKGWGSTPATILSETPPGGVPAQPLLGYNKPKGPLALPERGTEMQRSVQAVQSRGKKIELPQGVAKDLPHIGETYMSKASPVKNATPAVKPLQSPKESAKMVENKAMQEPPIYSKLSSQDAIANQLEKDGFDVAIDASNSPGSKSKYLTVSNDVGDTFKIRISNHDLPPKYGGWRGQAFADFEIGKYDSMEVNVHKNAGGLYDAIVKKLGAPVKPENVVISKNIPVSYNSAIERIENSGLKSWITTRNPNFKNDVEFLKNHGFESTKIPKKDAEIAVSKIGFGNVIDSGDGFAYVRIKPNPSQKEIRLLKELPLNGKVEKVAETKTFESWARDNGIETTITDHSWLSPDGKSSKRAMDVINKERRKRFNDVMQASEDYANAVKNGEVIDPSGKITKEKLLASESAKTAKDVSAKISSLESQIKAIEGMGTMSHLPNGKLKLKYQRTVDGYKEQIKKLKK